MPVPVTYAPQWRLAELVERERPVTLQCRVMRAGALAAPTLGIFTLFRPGKTVYVTGDVVVTMDGVATYALAAIPDTEALGEGWRIEWRLRMPDGVDHTFVTSAVVVKRLLYPVLSDQDLLDLHPGLADEVRPAAQSSWQAQIEASWWAVQRRLLQDARRPWLIVEPSALFEYHRALCLSQIFRAASTSSDPSGTWASLADHYAREAESAWTRIRFEYDAQDVATTVQRRSARSTTWLCPLDRPDFP